MKRIAFGALATGPARAAKDGVVFDAAATDNATATGAAALAASSSTGPAASASGGLVFI